jgi:uridine kinase
MYKEATRVPTARIHIGGGRRMEKTLLIGVAGGTGSGKTTVAERIVAGVDPRRAVILPQDAYYRDRSDLSPAERAVLNFDHPDAFDTGLLVDHLRHLAAHQPVDRPVYSFVDHVRLAQTVRIEPRDVVVVEGILVLAFPEVRDLLDIRVFVDTDDDVRVIRRLRRDIAERGRTLEQGIAQYLATVRPMHLQFVEPSRRFADVIVPEGGHNRVAVDLLAARIAQALAEPEGGR